ncbi:MAG: sigma-70 family RNA polymerase sigma factor [Acidobacteriota bacterium]
MKSSQQDITRRLIAWGEGDQKARDDLLPLVYTELRRLARNYLRRERAGHTLQPTALVHEAYLRLIDQGQARWQSRAHFFGIAARLMRQILIEYARSRNAAKRGGNLRVTLSKSIVRFEERDVDLLSLDDALRELEAIDSEKSRVVELRFFGGMSIEETACAMGISTATVTRHWRMARAWLYRRIRKGAKSES